MGVMPKSVSATARSPPPQPSPIEGEGYENHPEISHHTGV